MVNREVVKDIGFEIEPKWGDLLGQIKTGDFLSNGIDGELKSARSSSYVGSGMFWSGILLAADGIAGEYGQGVLNSQAVAEYMGNHPVLEALLGVAFVYTGHRIMKRYERLAEIAQNLVHKYVNE